MSEGNTMGNRSAVAGRRAWMLGLLAVLPGCSALQSRPYVEPLRFPLSPERPAETAALRPAAARGQLGTQTLLLRLGRAAPGLEGRMLRSIRADGTVHTEYYAEWSAPPAEAMEDALRRWLMRSGLFRAVLAPGTRAAADLALEVELTALHADLGRGEARAALSAVLLREGAGESSVVGQFTCEGHAPLPREGADTPAPQATAEVAALGQAFAALEAQIGARLGTRSR
ncbi:ABC-type transport auxiliary lipoprotein family protein [Roseomonas elaeocarpi]|uniref:ABC-type transport auxiliary lipoprotein family protein n=1 Tax=Roseomonas elaeocarpi TaxID=907779 RepID=A0ABV6JVA3_9PROT